MLTVKRPH